MVVAELVKEMVMSEVETAAQKMMGILNEKSAMEANELYNTAGIDRMLGTAAKCSLKFQAAVLEVDVSGREYLIMVPQRMTSEGIVVQWDGLKKAMEALAHAVNDSAQS